MKVLITGAGGLLGQKLLTLLHHKTDIDLIATANKPLPRMPKRGEFVLLDVTEQETVQRVIAYSNPDVIIHAAAMTQVDRCEQEREACWQANTLAVAHLVNACRATDARFILLSTDFVFDGQRGPLDEAAVPNPINYYGKSKLEAEKIVGESGLNWTIIRTALVYGVVTEPRNTNIVLWIKKSLEENKTIHVVNDQWRTPTLAEDLAMGCYQAACNDVQGIFHVSGEEILTPYDIAVKTARFFNLDLSLIQPTDSKTFTQPAKRPLKTGFIIKKAQDKLGYRPQTFEEGLKVVSSQLSAG